MVGWLGLGAGPNPDHVEFPASGVLRLYFDEPMTLDALFIALASYVIAPTGPGVPVAVATVSPGPGVNPEFVDICTIPWMTGGEGYEIAVNPLLTDAAGNPMATWLLPFIAPAPAAIQMDPMGLLETLTGVFGEEIAELAGYRQTRLTAPTVVGGLDLLVETTEGWAATGQLGLAGVVYSYTGVTPASFTGVSYVKAGVVTAGAASVCREGEAVADLNRGWSAFDLLRAGFLVDTAEGVDLTTIGRNLGVPRLRMFTSDSQFRGVVRALAYNPRGTLNGLRQALTALVGAGNFEIYEDLVKDPCHVTIRIDPTILASTGAAGKTWMTDQEWAALDGLGTGLVLAASPDRVHSVRVADLDELFDLRTAIPSALTYLEYPAGAPVVPFAYTGVDPEGPAVTLVPGSHVQMVSAGASVTYQMDYPHGARCFSHSNVDGYTAEVVLNAVLRVPAAGVWAGADKFELYFHDGNRSFFLTLAVAGGVPFVLVGSSAVATFALDEWVEVEIRRPEHGWLELWLDGTYYGRSPYNDALFPVGGAGPHISFGLTVASAGTQVDVRQLGAHSRMAIDFWALNGTGAPGAAPTQFDDSLVMLVPGDIGRTIVLRDSYAVNPQGGTNNFYGRVAAVPAPGQALLEGHLHLGGATVDGAAPTQVVASEEGPFVYPDDLGKTLVLSGSVVGNDGSYTITALIEEGTGVDLASYLTQYPPGVGYDPRETRRTRIAVVAGAAFVSEPGLDWRLDPAFIAEPLVGMAVHPVRFQLSDASTEAAGAITLRGIEFAAYPGMLMTIYLSQVLSAQLLPGKSAVNLPVGSYWPFYLSDLVGFLSVYLYSLLAAGIIPRFEPMT